MQAAKLAKQAQVRIYTVGVGADEMVQPGLFGSSFGARKVNPSADLDEAMLSQVAELSGGKYYRAKNREELQEIYQLLDELEPIELDNKTIRPYHSLFHWPLLAAALLLVLILLRQAGVFKFAGQQAKRFKSSQEAE